MISRRSFAWIAVAVLALGQSACVDSEHPLVAPEKSALDKQILGTWKSADPKEKGEPLQFLEAKGVKDAPAGLVELVEMKPKTAKDKKVYAYCASVGQDKYLHLLMLKNDAAGGLKQWNKADVQGYWICKYTVADDRLTLWTMDADETAKLINDGKLKGTVKKGMFGNDVKLQESSEGLQKFMAAGGGKSVYTDKSKAVLARVK